MVMRAAHAPPAQETLLSLRPSAISGALAERREQTKPPTYRYTWIPGGRRLLLQRRRRRPLARLTCMVAIRAKPPHSRFALDIAAPRGRGGKMNATRTLHDIGQSLWLDNITRNWLRTGVLRRYI